jgi:hypothetical protein
MFGERKCEHAAIAKRMVSLVVDSDDALPLCQGYWKETPVKEGARIENWAGRHRKIPFLPPRVDPLHPNPHAYALDVGLVNNSLDTSRRSHQNHVPKWDSDRETSSLPSLSFNSAHQISTSHSGQPACPQASKGPWTTPGGFMRFDRVLFLVFLGSNSLYPLTAQQSPASSVQAQPRDPQAVAVLARMAAATGWAPGIVPTTVIASGTLVHDGQESQPFGLKQRGPSQYVISLQPSGSTPAATIVVNGLARTTLSSDGTNRHFLGHAPLSFQSPAFPFLSEVVDTGDPSVEIQDLGIDTIDGGACRGVGVIRHAKPDDPLARFRELAAPLRVWISLQSGLPVRIDFIRLADDNPYVVMHFSRSFSDYRLVNHVAVAFHQEERFEGQLMYSVQFTDVQFNVAVTDADFAVSSL